jgi:hypothetical protein
VTLSDAQLDALRNLARKKAGATVGWIAIAEARGLTELGFALRNPSGWEITDAGAMVLAHHHRGGNGGDDSTVVDFQLSAGSGR